MTTSHLLDDLKKDEGLSLRAYVDIVSASHPITIGYGHTGKDVKIDTVWTEEEAEEMLKKDVEDAMTDLDNNFMWWRELNDARQDVLVNMCFNLGINRLFGFRRMLFAVKTEQWFMAQTEMLNSLWAHQVPHRAKRLANQMLTGKR